MTEHSFGCLSDQEALGLHDLSKAEVYQKPKEMMKYHLELTDDEVQNLAGILGSFIGKNERNKDIKELVESARNIFKKVIHKEEGCPDVMCEDCTKECGMKKLGLEVEK